MKIRCLMFLLGLCVAIMQYCYATEEQQRVVVAEVVKVVDGDTINVIVANSNEKLKVRLYGIDAPERKQKYGKAAKDMLSRLIGRRIVTLYVFGEDKYKRIIAKITCDHKYINLMMVIFGYAWYYREYSTDKELLLAEQKAREQRVGLWVDISPVRPAVYRRH